MKNLLREKRNFANFRFVAIDVDGTLVTSDKKLSEANIEAIKRAVSCGITVCICTGRPMQAMDQFATILGLENMPFILYNGAMVVLGASREVVYEQNLCEKDAKTLLALGQERKSTQIVWSKNRLYVNEINDRVKHYITINPMEPMVFTDVDALAKQGVTKIIWYDELVRIPELMELLENHAIRDSINFFTSHPQFLEIVDRRCDKALAIKRLIRRLDIRQEETLALGDGRNDIGMLRFAGLGIAMGNASDEVKHCAGAVTDTNDRDGVAKAIYQYVL